MRTISNILRSRQKIIHRAAAAAQGEASALITPRRKPTQSAKYVTEPANIRVENGYPARLNVTNALKRDTMPLPVHLVEERSVRYVLGQVSIVDLVLAVREWGLSGTRPWFQSRRSATVWASFNTRKGSLVLEFVYALLISFLLPSQSCWPFFYFLNVVCPFQPISLSPEFFLILNVYASTNSDRCMN